MQQKKKPTDIVMNIFIFRNLKWSRSGTQGGTWGRSVAAWGY